MEKNLTQDISLLQQFSEMLARIDSENALDFLLNFFSSKLRKVALKDIHPLILNALANNVCAKVLILNPNSLFSQTTNDFIEFLNEQQLLPPVYYPIFAKRREESLQRLPFPRLPAEEFRTEEGLGQLFGQLNGNLNKLLNIEFKAEKFLNKNFGYAIMEMNGDFVWCDPNSEKYFEIKGKELGSKNFFDMVIPFSKAYLTQKFGASLFSTNNSIGSSVSFSYVIYSKNSMNKFLKCLKKIGVSSEEEFKIRLKRKDSEDAIYHQYLKALSTRASLILLKFTDQEFQSILDSNKYVINPTRSFGDALGCRRSKNVAKLAKRELQGTASELLEMDDDGFAKSKELSEKVSEAEDKSRVMVRQMVLLETRLALNVPMFDYRKMSDDVKVKLFEQKIIKKITKGN